MTTNAIHDQPCAVCHVNLAIVDLATGIHRRAQLVSVPVGVSHLDHGAADDVRGKGVGCRRVRGERLAGHPASGRVCPGRNR